MTSGARPGSSKPTSATFGARSAAATRRWCRPCAAWGTCSERHENDPVAARAAADRSYLARRHRPLGRKHRHLRPAEELADRSSRLPARSEEHTSELQSPCNLVCRLLLEKKNYM